MLEEWRSATVHGRVNIVLMGIVALGIWIHIILIVSGAE
ncbi:hypothetical protein ACVWZB_000523 [Paenibacillus polymyxa]